MRRSVGSINDLHTSVSLAFFLQQEQTMSLNSMSQPQNALTVKQINLHRAIDFTSLIDRALQMAQTKNQKIIVLIQEPYIDIHSLKVLTTDIATCNT